MKDFIFTALSFWVNYHCLRMFKIYIDVFKLHIACGWSSFFLSIALIIFAPLHSLQVTDGTPFMSVLMDIVNFTEFISKGFVLFGNKKNKIVLIPAFLDRDRIA
ncbi:hypothetical protein [Desulfocicer niacini]